MPARLYIRDGQLKSHTFTVFVTERIDEGMAPRLILKGAHWVTKPLALEDRELAPKVVAPGQTRTITVDGTQISTEGTVLLFDLSGFEISLYKSAIRLLPILEWRPPAVAGGPVSVRRIVAEQEIYLGNMRGAALWTVVAMLIVAIMLFAWSKAKGPSTATHGNKWGRLLVTGPDGYQSLWRTQLMLWTFSVGSMVFLYGLVQLNVPEIPGSLVALMGMSLATGLAAKGGVPPQAPGATAPAPAAPGAGEPSTKSAPPRTTGPVWADLISTWNATTGKVELSIPKAQMVLWTFVVLSLFFVKSLLGGALWPVPWELVALTGISQAGYVGDKIVPTKAAPAA